MHRTAPHLVEHFQERDDFGESDRAVQQPTVPRQPDDPSAGHARAAEADLGRQRERWLVEQQALRFKVRVKGEAQRVGVLMVPEGSAASITLAANSQSAQ
jgi:hypothetical protein